MTGRMTENRLGPLNRRDRARVGGLAIRDDELREMSWDELCILKHVAGDAS